jgi:trigger factor
MVEMQIKREDLNPSTVKLEIECSEAQIAAGFERAIRDLSKKIKLPGFRPGKAPRKMVEEALNPQAVYENAAEAIVRKAYDEAITKEGIKPEGMPMVELGEFFRGGEKLESGETAEPKLAFVAKVPLSPVVELADYKGLVAQKPVVSVSDEEIDYQIEELRRGQGKKSDVVGRGVQEGDAVVLSLSAGEDDTRTFMVIAGQTFEDLDKALMGMATDDVKSETLSFPENFQHEAWKGKKQKTKIVVSSVSAFQLPSLDDEFAQGYNFENVDALRDRVRDGIQQVKDNAVRDMVRNQLIDELLEKSTVHVAENTWEGVVERRIRELGSDLQSRGATFEQYFESNNVTEEEFLTQLRDDARLNVRRAVVIQRLFQDHKMQLSQDDLNHYLRQVIAEHNVPQEQVAGFMQEYGSQIREEVLFRAMTNKVTDLLIESAKLEEVSLPSSDSGKADKKAPVSKAKKAPASGTAKAPKK